MCFSIPGEALQKHKTYLILFQAPTEKIRAPIAYDSIGKLRHGL